MPVYNIYVLKIGTRTVLFSIPEAALFRVCVQRRRTLLAKINQNDVEKGKLRNNAGEGQVAKDRYRPTLELSQL